LNEVMMVPVQEFNRLQDYYKGKLTENTLLNKAGRLAAEEHLILNDPNIPARMAVKMVKPMAREEGKLVKRLRTGTTSPITYQGTAEPEGMVDAPFENLLKQILKGQLSSMRNPPRQVLKRRKKGTKPPIPPKPSTSKKAAPSTSNKSGYSESTQKILRSLGLDDDDGGYSPKGAKGKKPKKTLLQKLQEGWEEWDNPSKRTLEQRVL